MVLKYDISEAETFDEQEDAEAVAVAYETESGYEARAIYTATCVYVVECLDEDGDVIGYLGAIK